MTRDGANHSLWQDEPDYIPQASWNRSQTYDALVAGAGITGLTTALLLQEQGKKVVIAEAHNVGFGTSGATTAHLNRFLDADYAVVEDDFGNEGAKTLFQAADDAVNLIETLVETYGIDCDFLRKTGYLFAQDEKEEKDLAKTAEACNRVGLQCTYADHVPVPVPFTKAISFEGEAQYHASKYLLGLARAFESLGGVILHACAVQTVKKEAEVFTADTTLGEIKAAAIVWATHIPPGINVMHFRNGPYRSYVLGVRLSDESQYPDALVYDSKDPYHYYRTIQHEGRPLLIAGGCDHKTGHESNTDHVFTELEAYLRGHFAVESVDYRWSSQYYEPSDGLPYIGHLPGGAEGEYCATGFSGNGQTLGTLSGIILSDLIATGSSPYADLLKPSRIKPVAGFMEFVKENADVVKRFVSDRFSYEKITELAEIAPGEGRLVDYEGEKLGVYKSETGQVHAINPVCPHAKCIVAWNSSEKSWDCPCHGARYAPSGELLTGPARHGLEVVQWNVLEGD